jgi:ferredoxin-type protein NapG
MGIGRIVASIAAVALAAEGGYCAAVGSSTLLRPPGIQSEADFSSRCIKCGKCALACKYKAIRIAGMEAGAAIGTPYLQARDQACRLCVDFPCTKACPTGALRNVEERTDAHMGYATIDENVCIAYQGYRCEVCYRVCPLIDQAITIEYKIRDNDSIHAKFIPTINKDVCTGCGLCVMRCVIDDPRVPIRIVTRGEQEKG